MSTPSRDDAKVKYPLTNGVYVFDQYNPSLSVGCKREKFLEIRNLILAALPPEAFVEDFDRENINEITISDLSADERRDATHPGCFYFLLVVFGTAAIMLTIIALAS